MTDKILIESNILLNCYNTNKQLFDILQYILTPEKDFLQQIILAYQLHPHYAWKYIQQKKDNFLYKPTNNIIEFILRADSANTVMSGYFKERNRDTCDQYIIEKIQNQIDKLSPIHDQTTQQELLKEVINILMRKVCKYIQTKENIQYFMRVCTINENTFFTKLVCCQQKLFEVVQPHYINEFLINPGLYIQQFKNIELSKQFLNKNRKFSVVYRCPKCKEKKCMFQPVQTAASDEETKTRVTCYSESCGYSWIH